MLEAIGIIGCGTMGSAIAAQLAQNDVTVVVYDTDTAKMEALRKREAKIKIVNSIDALFSDVNLALLAVKPQILRTLFADLSIYKEVGWISIAAGISLAELTEKLGCKDVVRLLPNIAAKRGESVTALAAAMECSPDHLSKAHAAAKTFGEVYEIAEELFSPFIGISGSAIAFILQFTHAIAMGGVAEGIPYHQALEIARATLASTTSLLEGGEHPVSLASEVCSAGGTTIEGMAALADGAFDATVIKAVQASSKRSRTLEEETPQTNRNEKD